VLGRPDGDGDLHFAGTTTELTAQQRADVAPLLRPAADHPWLPDGAETARWGANGKRALTSVQTTVVVEVSTDSTVQDGRWRHPTRLVRVRPDLSPSEVPVRDDA
jgi:hypothetical protein